MDLLEAGVAVGSVHADELGLGQTLEELAAVAFLQDAGIENGDDAFIVSGADEAPNPLAEFDKGFGEGELGERMPAAFFDILGFGLRNGMSRDVERKASDDDLLERGARHVDSGPETVRAKKHSVAGFEESSGHVRAAQALALSEEGTSSVDEFCLQDVGDSPQVGVAGEEDKAAS